MCPRTLTIDSIGASWDIFISITLWTYSNYPHDIFHYLGDWWHILIVIYRTSFFPPSYSGQILTVILSTKFSTLRDFADSNGAPWDIFISVTPWTYSNYPHHIFHYPADWWHILILINRKNFFPPLYSGQILTLILRSKFSALIDFVDSNGAPWDIFISVTLWTYSNYPHHIFHYPAHWWRILMVIRRTNFFPPSYSRQILTLILRSIFSALTDFADPNVAPWDIFISVRLWTYSNYPHDIFHYQAVWWHI